MQNLEIIKSKIFTSKEDINFQRKLAFWRFTGKKVVFTNGCFDILHRGHLEYLSKSADCGHAMVLGLNSDASVRSIKGESRPVQDETTRALLLAGFSFISAVVLFSEDTPYELIKTVQPDILVKGADYKPEQIVGYDIVMAKGGQVITIDLTEGFSTTSIVNKMK